MSAIAANGKDHANGGAKVTNGHAKANGQMEANGHSKANGNAKAAEPELPHGYHFLGPPGATIITIALPLLQYAFEFGCNAKTGCPAPALFRLGTVSSETLKHDLGWPKDGIWGLASWDATFWTLAYYLFNAVLQRVLPAQEVEGTVLANGGRLKYRFNAFSSTMFTLAICAAGTIAQGADFPVWVYISDNFLQILTVNIIISYALATYCYINSFSVKKGNPELRELAAGGHMGNIIYDWFIGRELNPRVTLPLLGEIDIKMFMEIRPGMLAWILFDCAWIAKQYRNYGYVTDSIILITVMQSIYILDGVYMEAGCLTMMDITQDGFGFMLAFGDLAWLPFLYCQQARYLATHPVHLGVSGLAILAVPLLIGFSIFRLSNSQKNQFRTNPDDPKLAHLKYIETKVGTRLLISGWWGRARHINYFGDWIQAWPYCMVTGVAGYTILAPGTGAEGAYVMADGREVVPGAARGWGMIFTYLYIVYFAVLLVHRQLRDDEKCERKYGEDWKRYCSIVRSRIVPGIY